MSVIQWCSGAESRLPSVDEGHQVLVEIINDLHDAMMRRASDQTLASLVERLREYAGSYLCEEERYLGQRGEPHTAAHLSHHELLRRELGQLEADVAAHRQIMPIEVLGFLRAWLRDHRAAAPAGSQSGACA